MSQPTIERDWPSPKDDRPGFLVRTPYRESFLDQLKAHVPRADRLWDPDGKVWWCSAEHEEAVTALLRMIFGGAMIVSDEGDYYVSASGERCSQEGLF